MTRIALAAFVACLLACAGLDPALKPHVTRAFSIDLLDGTVTEDSDYGAHGDFDVEKFGRSQSLSWTLLEPDEDLEQDAKDLWQGMQRALAAMPDPPDAPASVPITRDLVEFREAWGFETAIGFEWLTATTWPCPDAGVRVTLITTGTKSRAQALHETSLASARCGLEPVALDAAAASWVFTGDPGRWIAQDADSADGGEWLRSDGAARLVVSGQDAVSGDPELPHLCREMMRQIHENLLDTYVFDPKYDSWEETQTGCAHGWAGTRTDDGSFVRGRFDHEACGGRGYVLTCLVFAGDEPPEVACGHPIRCPG